MSKSWSYSRESFKVHGIKTTSCILKSNETFPRETQVPKTSIQSISPNIFGTGIRISSLILVKYLNVFFCSYPRYIFRDSSFSYGLAIILETSNNNFSSYLIQYNHTHNGAMQDISLQYRVFGITNLANSGQYFISEEISYTGYPFFSKLNELDPFHCFFQYLYGLRASNQQIHLTLPRNC